MARKEELKNVPAAKVEKEVQDYKDAGATDVKSTKQLDGKFTITATFEDNGSENAGCKHESKQRKTEGSGASNGRS